MEETRRGLVNTVGMGLLRSGHEHGFVMDLYAICLFAKYKEPFDIRENIKFMNANGF